MTMPSDRSIGALREVLWHRLWESRFRDRFRRVVDGLRSPRGSGERKYAILQLKRLWAPFSALVVPALAFVLLVLLVSAGERRAERRFYTIAPSPDPAVPDLDPIKLDRRLADPRNALPHDVNVDVPSFDDRRLPGRPAPVPLEAAVSITPLHVVDAVRSPLRFRGVYERRLGSGKADALRKGGARAGSEDAVTRALRWLKKHQEPDGSWHLGSGGSGGRGAAPAMTGLALLAFLARGETPDDRCVEFGPSVRRGLEWLLGAQLENGRFRGQDSHEYGHPIATYALCEGFGLTRNPALREPAERAVSVIVAGQNPDGGWNYNCKPSRRNDTSYTGWCVQALKAAQIAGVRSAGLETCLRNALQGVRRNASAQHDGFGYTAPGRHRLTCVSVLAMQLLGAAQAPETRGGLRMLENATCDWATPWGRCPIYYWYYITQAKFHAGGAAWRAWNAQFAAEFMQTQVVEKDGLDGKAVGHWKPAAKSEHCQSTVYSTTLCVLSLEVYYRILGSLDPGKVAKHSLFEADDDEEGIVIEVVKKRGASPSPRRLF